MPLHILFVLMSALVLYFVNKNCLKFKFDLNSNGFAIVKDLKIQMDFLFPIWPWAET
jgi:hypothetical protein